MFSKYLDNLSPGKFALILVLPSTLLLSAIISYPFVDLVYSSLCSYDMRLNTHFVGLKNFFALFSDSLFWNDLSRSLIYTAGSVTLFFIIGFAVALSLNKVERFQTLLRGGSLLPWAIPPVTAAMMWRWALNTQYGVVNDLLTRIGLIADPIKWLSTEKLTMGVMTFVDAWIRIPFVALLLLAGLKAIPGQLYESASIDGAGVMQRFWYITLPSLRYPISIVLSLQTMFAFRTYAIMSVLTGGGPGSSTELLVKYIYDSAFKSYNFGIAAAASLIMFILSFIFVAIYWRTLHVKV